MGSIYDLPSTVHRLELRPNRRILVISDIHGNLEYFRQLLSQAVFTPADELIIDGDFLEKGSQCLDTVFFIMELALRGNVHVVRGNCDGWHTVFDHSPEEDQHMLRYVQWRKCGLIYEMLKELGYDPMALTDLTAVKGELHAYDGVFNFLRSLPDVIETERFTFVHSGYNPSKPLEEHLMGELDRIDRFMDKGYSFDKWVIVGHYPVMLYGEDRVCANPIIDRERKIVSIDGACVLKDDGQLNALIIPNRDSDDFFFECYDHFPTAKVLNHQSQGGKSYYIRWGDSQVQVLQRGDEFSRCRHVRTGYEMDILTKYLFTDNEITDCNDCTDYVLPLEAGDIVRVVERTSRGYFVKHNGYSGWYYGELEDE